MYWDNIRIRTQLLNPLASAGSQEDEIARGLLIIAYGSIRPEDRPVPTTPTLQEVEVISLTSSDSDSEVDVE